MSVKNFRRVFIVAAFFSVQNEWAEAATEWQSLRQIIATQNAQLDALERLLDTATTSDGQWKAPNETVLIDKSGSWKGQALALPGPRGDKGADGANGRNGSNGINGADGTEGLPGDSGNRGPTGQRGPVGPKGDKGPRGLECNC